MSPAAILGEKVGMTRIFDDQARAIPVTVIKAGPCHVTQIRTEETDGYAAVQLAYGRINPSRANKPEAGHYAKAGVEPTRHLLEVRVDDVDGFRLGQELRVGDLFVAGGKADVTGVSKGKGFQGVMKRHNFHGQAASHGAHKIHRAPGAIGACATPARVFKGTKLPGRMGGDRTTVLNLVVVGVDTDRDLLVLQGAVPGPKGGLVFVREAVKSG
ncbi:MAG: 50S ribosomal protein L3 [bacterium]|nr:50S ribosomal protein L3 [bacterium]MDE0289916.1 50S ribosomal protein L3 [bacterium]MDE0439037.1 50S ribosomal protein L3 [bacterium]